MDLEQAALKLLLAHSHAEEVPPFLLLVDHWVRQSSGPAGFDGSVAIVLRTERADVVWVGLFGESGATTGFLARLPREVNAVLLIHEEDARVLASEGRLPKTPRLTMLGGDLELFGRFIDRYLSRTNFVGVRSWKPNK